MCAKPIHGDHYRHLSPERLAAEIKCLRDYAAPDHLWFADDIFALSRRCACELADRIQESGFKVPFKMQSRCDLMTRDRVQSLARARCGEVWMGVESASQQVLDRMEKGIRAEHVTRASENLRRQSIRIGLFLQFGYPGEEWEDIEQTIEMVRSVQPDDVGVSVSYPLPNTRFHQIVSQSHASQNHWRDSRALAISHKAAFPSDFYQALSAALHMEVARVESERNVRAAWDRVEQIRCAFC